MCKIVELKWTKQEIIDYIRCNYDQLCLLAKNKGFKVPVVSYKDKPIETKAELITKYILRRTTSEHVVETCLKYYRKICEFSALLKLELYN